MAALRPLPLALAASTLAACIGSTGGDLVTFPATVHGPAREGAVPRADGDHRADPLVFTTASGWTVTLTRATSAIGALYLAAARPLQNVRESACYAATRYVGEVRGAKVVDLLDPTPQPLPGGGQGVSERALSAEVWLGGGAIDAPEDPAVVLAVDGTATRGPATIPFTGRFTIGANRKRPPQSAALPGSNPLCQQRIITPILVDLRLAEVPVDGGRGGLDLAVDPRAFFATVAFDELPAPATPGGVRAFLDREEGQPSIALYQGLRAADGRWSFTFGR